MDNLTFRQRLLDGGVLLESDVVGLYHRSFAFESIVRGVEAYVSRSSEVAEDHRYFFSPYMAKETLVTTGYVRSFPNLVGLVSSFQGTERDAPAFTAQLDAGEDWESSFSSNGLATCSAACHSLYPLLAHRRIEEAGLVFEVQGTCFRHEPSEDVARMQSFRQHEFVFVGGPDAALQHRQEWLARADDLLRALGLGVEIVEANDPFFGRAGKMLASGQREKSLKFEVTCPISSQNPGAIASGNYHEDHFGVNFDIRMSNGDVAHSACIGFGLERIALSLLLTHGPSLQEWPREVRGLLSLGANTDTFP